MYVYEFEAEVVRLIFNMYEVALYILERIRDAASSPAMALPFVSRMEVDREGSTYVEFALKDRTPSARSRGF